MLLKKEGVPTPSIRVLHEIKQCICINPIYMKDKGDEEDQKRGGRCGMRWAGVSEEIEFYGS